MKRASKHSHKVVAVLISVLIVLIAVVVGTVLIFTQATKPTRTAKKQAISIAKDYADMQQTDDFYWFTWKDTYYSVTGTDSNGKKIIAVIPEDGGNVRVVNQSDGYSEKEIRTIVRDDYKDPTIQKVNFGWFDKQAVWEVITKEEDGTFCYYLLSFKTGEEIKSLIDV